MEIQFNEGPVWLHLVVFPVLKSMHVMTDEPHTKRAPIHLHNALYSLYGSNKSTASCVFNHIQTSVKTNSLVWFSLWLNRP